MTLLIKCNKICIIKIKINNNLGPMPINIKIIIIFFNLKILITIWWQIITTINHIIFWTIIATLINNSNNNHFNKTLWINSNKIMEINSNCHFRIKIIII